MMFNEYAATNPGSLTFHSHSACGHQATHVKALSYLSTEASDFDRPGTPPCRLCPGRELD